MAQENRLGAGIIVGIIILGSIIRGCGNVRNNNTEKPHYVSDALQGEEGRFEISFAGVATTMVVKDGIALLTLEDGTKCKLFRTSPGQYSGGTFGSTYTATLYKNGQGYSIHRR